MSKPDYTKHGRRSLWTLVEAAYLLADEEPQSLAELLKQSGAGNAGIAGEIYDELKNAVDLREIDFIASRTGKISNCRVQPAECIVWARHRGYTVPDQLAAAVRQGRPHTPSATSAITEMPWIALARDEARKIHSKKPKLKKVAISGLVHDELKARRVTGRGGKTPSAETIRKSALRGMKF